LVMKASRNSGSLFLRVPPGGVAFSEVGVFDKSPERQSTSRVAVALWFKPATDLTAVFR